MQLPSLWKDRTLTQTSLSGEQRSAQCIGYFRKLDNSLRLRQLASSGHHQLSRGQVLWCQSDFYGVIPDIDHLHSLKELLSIVRSRQAFVGFNKGLSDLG